MSSREAPYPESFEAKKKAEIDAAWEAHNFTDYPAQVKEIAAQAEERRRWLEAHLISQKGLCGYCSIVTTDAFLPGLGDRRATIDHIVPRSRGGSDTFENTLVACSYCNSHKGSSSVEEYKNSVDLIRRLKVALKAPDRLSIHADSAFYDERALDRGIGVRFKGKERSDVLEYSVLIDVGSGSGSLSTDEVSLLP